jgi:hypothetical protein
MVTDRTQVSHPAVARSYLLVGVACAFVASTVQAQGHVITRREMVADSRRQRARHGTHGDSLGTRP